MIFAARFCMALLLALCGALLAYFFAPNILALLLPEAISKPIAVLIVLIAAGAVLLQLAYKQYQAQSHLNH